jgi:hypothetical protein
MALRGSLEEMSFGELLGWISMAGRTGTLVVREGKAEKLFTFEKKRLISATSNLEWERLGSILVRKRLVDPPRLKEALTSSGKRGVRLGKALVDLGVLSEEELYYLLILQADTVVFDMFFWETGRFVFYSEIKAFEHLHDLPFTLDYLLLEGARRMDEALVIRSMLPSPFVTFRIDPARVTDDPFKRRILLAAKEGLSLVEMMVSIPQAEFSVLRAAFELFKEGAIVPGPEKTLANLRDPQFFLEFLEHGCNVWRAKRSEAPFLRPKEGEKVPDDIKRYQDYYARLALEWANG